MSQASCDEPFESTGCHDAYHLARLAGGTRRIMELALVKLASEDVLFLEEAGVKLADTEFVATHAVERCVIEALRGAWWHRGLSAIEKDLERVSLVIDGELQRAGLRASGVEDQNGTFVCFFLCAAIASACFLIGGPALWAVGVFFALAALCFSAFPSPHSDVTADGRRVLSEVQRDARERLGVLSSMDDGLDVSVAVLGWRVLMDTSHAWVAASLSDLENAEHRAEG